LSAIEQSRMGEAQLQLKRQAAAARARAGEDELKTPPVGLITNLLDQRRSKSDDLARLPQPDPGGIFRAASDPFAEQRVQLGNELRELDNYLQLYTRVYGGTPTGGQQEVPYLGD
jgi:hypothetical protein